MKKRQRLRKGLILVSFFLMPATFYYLSPYLIVDASAKGIINGSFVLFGLLFFSSLFLGRAFCGWVCPGAGVQEAIMESKDKIVKRGNCIKWIIWIPWIVSIILVAIKTGGYTSIDITYQTSYGFSIGNLQGLITYLGVLLLIVLPAFLVGRRSFCHSICWMAPFMIIGRKFSTLLKIPSLKLKTDIDSCTHCKKCESVCSMSLPVEKMLTKKEMENSECILCGMCIDSCKSNVIKFYFGN